MSQEPAVKPLKSLGVSETDVVQCLPPCFRYILEAASRKGFKYLVRIENENMGRKG